jgi:hypothetical protein
MDEAAGSGAVPAETTCEDTPNVLDHDFGSPVCCHATLELLNSIIDAVLRGTILGLIRGPRDDVELVGRRADFNRLVHQIRQVRCEVVPDKDAMVVRSVWRWVLFKVTTDAVNKLRKVDLIDAALVEDFVPNPWPCDRTKEGVGHIRVSGLNGEDYGDLCRPSVVTRLANANAWGGSTVLVVATRKL